MLLKLYTYIYSVHYSIKPISDEIPIKGNTVCYKCGYLNTQNPFFQLEQKMCNKISSNNHMPKWSFFISISDASHQGSPQRIF